jgi:hypothetical protein
MTNPIRKEIADALKHYRATMGQFTEPLAGRPAIAVRLRNHWARSAASAYLRVEREITWS